MSRRNVKSRIPQKSGCATLTSQGSDLKALVSAFHKDFHSCFVNRDAGYKAAWDFAPEDRAKAIVWQNPGDKSRGHQYCIRVEAREQAVAALHAIDRDEFGSFEDIYQYVEETVRPVYGIGALTHYDADRRIGVMCGIEPDRMVYLHAGAEKGAKRLGVKWRGHSIEREKLPKSVLAAVGPLSTAEIEEFFCISKDDFEGIEIGV